MPEAQLPGTADTNRNTYRYALARSPDQGRSNPAQGYHPNPKLQHCTLSGLG